MMKLMQEFVLREIAGDNILVPIVGAEDGFQGIITLNETGVFIWKCLEKEYEKEQIVDALLEEYDVTAEMARKNVDDFCRHLEDLKILK